MAVLGNISKVLGMAPGTYINQPRVWSGSQDATYMVKFLLFNTLAVADIKRNAILKRRLQMSTLHDQQSVIMASPPALFEVEIPGVRYSPAAVISNLAVNNVGQINYIDGVNVPDAYEIQITITELITESRQILNDSWYSGTAHKIRAISSSPLPIIQEAAGAAQNTSSQTTQNVAANNAQITGSPSSTSGGLGQNPAGAGGGRTLR